MGQYTCQMHSCYGIKPFCIPIFVLPQQCVLFLYEISVNTVKGPFEVAEVGQLHQLQDVGTDSSAQ